MNDVDATHRTHPDASPELGRIATERRGHLFLIGIDRPAKYNGFTPKMCGELARAYANYEADDGLRCAVLHAAGDHFTAGLELSAFDITEPDFFPRDLVDPFDLRPPFRAKPVVAAVKGICFTIGIELMLAADVVVAEEDTRFSQLEVKRGLMAFGGATIRFVERAGWGQRPALAADRRRVRRRDCAAARFRAGSGSEGRGPGPCPRTCREHCQAGAVRRPRKPGKFRDLCAAGTGSRRAGVPAATGGDCPERGFRRRCAVLHRAARRRLQGPLKGITMSDDIRQQHDMGGLDKGPVTPSAHEIEPWEKRVEAIMRLLSMRKDRIVTVDELRRGIEELPPELYDTIGYYERWIASLSNILVEKGVLDRAELDARVKALEAGA